MKTFAQILYFSPTSRLWREAYFYYLTKEFLENFCQREYAQILPIHRPIQIFVNQDKLLINLKITSSNSNLLADLKQKKDQISTLLHAHLVKQKIITKKFQIIIKTALT